MARRLKLQGGHAEHVRLRIKTLYLVNKLQKAAAGEIEMTPVQLEAAKTLLRKVLPDLSTVETSLTGDLTHNVISAQPMTDDEWEAKYCLEPGKSSDLN